MADNEKFDCINACLQIYQDSVLKNGVVLGGIGCVDCMKRSVNDITCSVFAEEVKSKCGKME